ncbi:SDR family oxidoreductase, partial [Streptomyces sp. SID5914]
DWDRVMAVNVRSAFLTMRSVLPSMAERGHGAIVNIASVAALRGSRNLTAYATSKHALLGLTRSAVAEFASRGVRVNAVCPGPIDTPLQQRAEHAAADPTRFRGDQESAIPQGRYGAVAEVADVVLFLLSDAASYVNGATVTVDGGMTATM